MKNLRSFSIAATTLFVMAPQYVYAQAITAKVVGTVSDPSGAAVPTAIVSIHNVQTNQVRSTKTNEVGNYEFSFLPIGEYTLSIEAPGFQKAEISQFQLNVDQVARVNVQLTVGEVSEKVSVEASAVGLQTETSNVGTVIDSQKVVELPLNGRSFVQLALLTPGVNPGTPGSITVRRNRGAVGQQVGMSANGARDTQNRFYYDGIEAMDLDSYNFSFSPSVDAIQEFRVDTSTYSAEVGGAPGGQVNLMTKSGTSQLHGGAWEFNRNDAFAALAPFQPFTRERQAAPPQPESVRRQHRRAGADSESAQEQREHLLLLQLGIGTPGFRLFRRNRFRTAGGIPHRQLFRVGCDNLRSLDGPAFRRQYHPREPDSELCHQIPDFCSGIQYQRSRHQLSRARRRGPHHPGPVRQPPGPPFLG